MSRGRNYTVGERAVIAIGAAAGKTVAEVNAVLEAGAKHTGGTFRPVNATSMGMAPRYPSLSRDYAEGLWDHITRPKALSEPHAPTLDPAVLAEERLAALLAAEAENTALRQQVAALTRLGVSLHKAEQAGVDAERIAVVAWLREVADTPVPWVDDAIRDAALAVERGDHWNRTAPAGKAGQGAP
jgi:hypothetical protein